jgi:serine/threonine-protein kinase RsbT
MGEFDQVREMLERYLSPMIARSTLERALRERHVSPAAFKRSDVYKIAPLLRRAIALFVSENERSSALRDLDELCSEVRATVKSCRVNINSENDISVVRNEARRVCEEVGAEGYTIQKVTTIVSELARNIVSYAERGTLELIPEDEPDRKMVVRASDQGSGIPNLELILSGHYRSKTGLGRGLLGTKRLADHFDIKTGPTGTLVVAEIRL